MDHKKFFEGLEGYVITLSHESGTTCSFPIEQLYQAFIQRMKEEFRAYLMSRVNQSPVLDATQDS
jgi:hypothetical protein